MQFAKDSFYVALRDRLTALDPGRTIVVAGRMRPAVLVDENEPANSAPPLPNAFHLAWGIPEIVKGAESARRPLMKLDCTIAYRIAGAQSGAVDRDDPAGLRQSYRQVSRRGRYCGLCEALAWSCWLRRRSPPVELH